MSEFPDRCHWYYGWDNYVTCGTHRWTGYRDERTRYSNRIVCPIAADILGLGHKPMLSLPGLPSSFPVGSVSGSPHGAHAYNVEPLEEEAP